MENVRLGIIGMGIMGAIHARTLLDGKIPACTLAAISDTNSTNMAPFPSVPQYASAAEMMNSGSIDAVLIATPHYSHTSLGIAGLQAGLHVLIEKPISVHKADCERLLDAHTNSKLIFAAMFNQRTDPRYMKLRELIQSGELGRIQRINWIITDWFRTQAYYNSGGWRATWEGEGGGVLLNQCPHQLDLWQWLFGMPDEITAFCQIGRYHDIEVEDNVTAYFEYEDGTTGSFITSTGEAPGVNRLEVSAERGLVKIENGKITYRRNEVEMSVFCRTAKEKTAKPNVRDVEISLPEGYGSQHPGILKNFTDAILHKTPLIAPASEGIRSVELANAMILSSFEKRTIRLPMDAAAYETLLRQKSTEFESGRNSAMAHAAR